MNWHKWIEPYARAYRWRFLLIIVLGSLAVFAAAALMFTSGFLISKAALRPENILMIYVPIVGVRTFGISRAALHYVERLVGHDAILRILSKMRVSLYRMLEPQALFVRSRFRTGDILGVLADDIEHLQDVYLRTIFPSVIALVMYAAAVLALGRFDVSFALLMSVYLAVIVLVVPWLSLLATRRSVAASKQRRNRLYGKLTDAVLGISDWVISGRQAHFVRSYEEEERQIAAVERSMNHWNRWRSFTLQLIVGVAVVSILFWSGKQHADGKIADTMIAAFVLVVFSLADVFLPVSDAVQKIPQYQDSFSRLDAIDKPVLNDQADQVLQPLYFTETNAKLQQQAAEDEVLRIAGKHAHIRLSSVSYGYNDGESGGAWAVRNLTLDIPQGKKIAVIGRSGAGKSTLLKLIQGALAPTQGTVSINNVNIAVLADHIAHVISVLNQNPHLFDTTVANNIRLGRRAATDEEVLRAARQARLDELIQSLPEGYRTPMQETGQRFSGGERQRIALARVLLQNTPVVILDEPTVGLDMRTEMELLRNVFHSLQDKTLIWVTHHLLSAELMDEVIFMENGAITKRGTHEQLMAHDPHYRQLYELDRL